MKVFGEDRRKVENIVARQMPNFQELYRPLLQEKLQLRSGGGNSSEIEFVQDVSSKARFLVVKQLPKRFKGRLLRQQLITRGSYPDPGTSIPTSSPCYLL
jgi:hypothetical protein